ncbi:MAG: flagellin, partial [Planctomycetota bacterium]
IGSINATINAAGNGLTLSGAGADAIEVADLGGTFAADLGLVAKNAAGVPVIGGDVQARVTDFTPLATLNGGAGIDPAGLQITLGDDVFVVDLTGVTNVGELRRAIGEVTPDLELRINAAGDGVELLNNVQGRRLGIGENGGDTAADLGIRTFDGDVALTDLDDGRGVPFFDSGDDLRITDSAGTSVDLDLNGTSTVQDVLDAINGAAVGVTATLNINGNGITLTDTAAGPGTLVAADLNGSRVTEVLGFDQPAVANVITGTDPQRVEARGVFNSLQQLSDGLRDNDVDTIRQAAAKLEEDIDRIIAERGRAGAISQDMIQRRDRIDERQIATERMLSDMEDVEYGEAVAHYQTLTTAIEATYRSTSSLLNLSLLNYL